MSEREREDGRARRRDDEAAAGTATRANAPMEAASTATAPHDAEAQITAPKAPAATAADVGGDDARTVSRVRRLAESRQGHGARDAAGGEGRARGQEKARLVAVSELQVRGEAAQSEGGGEVRGVRGASALGLGRPGVRRVHLRRAAQMEHRGQAQVARASSRLRSDSVRTKPNS